MGADSPAFGPHLFPWLPIFIQVEPLACIDEMLCTFEVKDMRGHISRIPVIRKPLDDISERLAELLPDCLNFGHGSSKRHACGQNGSRKPVNSPAKVAINSINNRCDNIQKH
jgi:hypothetical protein